MNEPIAHYREKDGTIQSVWQHLEETSRLCREFSEKISLGDLGEILGLFHDLGKGSDEFQRYIASATGLIQKGDPRWLDAEAYKGKIDHASAGAQKIYANLSSQGPERALTAQVLALCVAAHHSELLDCVTPEGESKFTNRMQKPDEKTHADEAWSQLNPGEQTKLLAALSKDVEKQLVSRLNSIRVINDSQLTAFKSGLLVRFLFSCLIDADRLSTIDFDAPGNQYLRNYGKYRPWETLIERLDARLAELEQKENRNQVDLLRSQVSQDCLNSAAKGKGIFRLTVPTGGGKTLASLRFALNHAAIHGLERVFYVIPYTSIIDQNANEVRQFLEDRDQNGRFLDRVVLEHHSNLTPEEETRRHNLLAENWDAPVVFTTQVQFLEALFGSGTRGVRRMHQLANSVIIFDEVQTLPIRMVHMFNLAIRFLVKGCGASVVLCTATQPLLDQVDPPQRSLVVEKERKIISDEEGLFAQLKRVQAKDCRKPGGWSDEAVATLARQELEHSGSVLVIVNTKKSALTLFNTIHQEKKAHMFHLSTNMCPAHRLHILEDIKQKLGKEPLICISTQLIEAGVDIDFGCVIRYLAGLDSMAQAAGRCNRHGRRETGHVWIVNPEQENVEPLTDIVVGQRVAERILDDFRADPMAFQNDLLGLTAMEQYYQYYFHARKAQMSYPVHKSSLVGREDNLFNLLSLNTESVNRYQQITHSAPPFRLRQAFQTAAKVFEVIDTPTRGVIVPYKEGRALITKLCGMIPLEERFRIIKMAQRYSVNLLPHELKKMIELGAVQETQTESGILYMDDRYYSDFFGWGYDPVKNQDLLYM